MRNRLIVASLKLKKYCCFVADVSFSAFYEAMIKDLYLRTFLSMQVIDEDFVQRANKWEIGN